MKKRIVAMATSIVLCVSLISNISLANLQIPVDNVSIDEVYYIITEDTSSGDTKISPTMTASWEDPESWYGNESDDDYHDPDFYEITINNVTLGTEDSFITYEGSTVYEDKTFEVHEETTLETGSIYKIIVEPQHYHTTDEGAYELADVSGTAEYAYAITELDVEFNSDEDSIEIMWDDLGSSEFEYRIVYALGDYTNSSLQDLEDNMEGEITGLYYDSDGVDSYYDSSDGRDKLSYTITENIYPGQIYSIVVEPLVDYYDGEEVTRNHNYPYIRSTSTDVELSLEEDGEYLRLEWDIPESFQVGQDQDEYSLVEATLVEYKDGVSSNIAIFDGTAAIIGYYKITKPSESTDYQIFFVYDAVDEESLATIEPESTIVSYDPSDILITPTSPVVPDLFSESILADLQENYTDDEIRDILEEDYLVPSNTYDGDIDDILEENVTFHIEDEDDQINFVFGAFERIDVDEDSDTYGEYIFDNTIYYTIWVTNDYDKLEYATPLYEDKLYNSISTPNNLIYEGDELCGYYQAISQFYNDETDEIEALVEDDIYYIKVVATNITASEDLTSEATISSVYYTYGGDAYQPPTISKPPLQEDTDLTTTTEITVKWKESWYEIIDPDATSSSALYTWQPEVWVDEDGNIYNSDVDNSEYFAIYDDESEIIRLESYLESLSVDLDILQKTIELGENDEGVSDVEYLFEYIEYAEIQETIELYQEVDETYTFSDYYVNLIQADQDGSSEIGWTEIEVEMEDDDYISLTQDNLLPNTSYLFMIYPYRITASEDVLYAQYPTPIIVTTEPEESEVVADPTVPNLYVTGGSEMSLDLSFKYDTEFDYEIVYSEYEDFDTAESVDWVLEDENDDNYPVDGEYYEMTVDDLFPDTDYYFWIQATQPLDGTTSAWSNSTMGTTDDVDYPNPPRGFGIASEVNMGYYSYDDNVTDEYIGIEWILDEDDDYGEEDTEDGNTSEVTRYYTYLIEIADNEDFIDPTYVESSGGVEDVIPTDVSLLNKNIIVVENLISNRSYYFRARTQVTIYNADNTIVKVSQTYTDTIEISTESTENEYDGEIDPSLEVLPSTDYELIYDSSDQSLAFRFYDGSGGENSVVQRVVSDIVEDNIYNYKIDVSNYEGEEIQKRTITIPYDIIEVFNEYDVTLTVLADDIELVIPSGSIEKVLEDQVSSFGVAPEVEIEIEALDDFYLEEEDPDSGISEITSPQDVSVSLVSEKGTTKLNYSDEYMTVNLKTDSRYELYGMDYVTYVKNHKDEYIEVDATFDSYNSNITFETAKIGAYGAYIVGANDYVTSDNSHWSNPYREAVFEAYNVKGLDDYEPTDYVTEAEIVNVVYQYIEGSKDIDLDGYLSSNLLKALVDAGVRTTTSKDDITISREAAISMLVRAYEITSDEMIEVDPTIYANVLSDSSVSNDYKVSVAKAATIGLISSTSNNRGSSAITYAELFVLWSKL